MKLGIGSYAYMWSIGFPGAAPPQPMAAWDLLEQARALRVDVVQYGPNLPLDSMPHAALKALVRRACESGIEIEVGTRGLDTGHLRRQVALAQCCGATLLRTVPETPDGGIPSPAEIEQAVRAVVPILEAAGVRLALENSHIPARVLASVLDAVGSRSAGITLDTVNSLAIPEGTEEVATTLAPHTFCLHVKDFIVRRVWHMMGFEVEGRPAGQGQLNVPWLLKLLARAGASPNAILELWPPRQNTLEETTALEQAWAVESISYLRTLIPVERRQEP